MNLPIKSEVGLLSEIAEMKRIYTAIENTVEDPGAMCILVSSALTDEGKSMVSAGLASLASLQDKKRVLAIDLNWFKPALHTFFGLEQRYDVNALQNGAKISDLTQPSGMDHLEILTAPKLDHNDPESFQTWTTLAKKIVKQARDTHDVLIIDTCSLFPTNRRMLDPVVFSGIVDGVVLVTLGHVTHRQEIKRAKMILETSGMNVLGVIFNKQNTPD